MFPKEYSQPVALQTYIGKVCTIMVVPTALPTSHYTKQDIMLQFSGVVNNITDKGIGITNPLRGTKNFFFFPHIIGLIEEEVIEDKKAVEVIKKAQDLQSKHIDLEELKAIQSQNESSGKA